MAQEFSGIPADAFIGPQQAVELYRLRETPGLATELDEQLSETGIAKIAMPVSPEDFDELNSLFDACLEDDFPELAATHHRVDSRWGNEAGHSRKERKLDPITGQQIEDAKDLFHFNRYALLRWREQFTGQRLPENLQNFLDCGTELFYALGRVARDQILQLEPRQSGITALYCGSSDVPRNTYLRVISSDHQASNSEHDVVSKPHLDLSGITIQAYADLPGFWGTTDWPDGERVRYDTEAYTAHLFLGAAHAKLFGQHARLQPLLHGVDENRPSGQKRHADVFFVDPVLVDCGLTPTDVLPHLWAADSQTALAKA